MVLCLHNAEFQGSWDAREEEVLERLLRIFGLSEAVYAKYVHFSGTFHLLHAATSYIREFQSGEGVVAVSTPYAERAYRRYDAFWGLPGIRVAIL